MTKLALRVMRGKHCQEITASIIEATTSKFRQFSLDVCHNAYSYAQVLIHLIVSPALVLLCSHKLIPLEKFNQCGLDYPFSII